MTQAVTRVRSAVQFAEAAKALGWEVKRKIVDGDRFVIATRGAEQYAFVWEHDDDTDRDNFASGIYTVEGQSQEWSNVSKALRLMAEDEKSTRVVEARVVSLPFDIFTDDDKTILDALAGRTVTWTNSMTGADEEGTVPARGKHTKIEYRAGETLDARTITFVAVGTGFRSARLNTIVEVG